MDNSNNFHLGEEDENTFIADRNDPEHIKNILSTISTQENILSTISTQENILSTISTQENEEDDDDEPDGISAEFNPTEYNFNHKERGYAVIINNTDVEGLPVRKGADVDSTNLFGHFKDLEFNVKIFKNCQVNDMKEIIESFSKLDHTDADCFVCCVLSHGREGDEVYGSEGELINLEDLAEPFKNCKSLLGKPKIFVIQACRGDSMDSGITTTSDGPSDANFVGREDATIHFPREADFLWVYATPPGYKSWRNKAQGSWFIQSLSQAIAQFGKSMNFLHVLTVANYICANRFESHSTRKPDINEKLQSSNYSCRLTKNIFFKPKQQIFPA